MPDSYYRDKERKREEKKREKMERKEVQQKDKEAREKEFGEKEPRCLEMLFRPKQAKPYKPKRSASQEKVEKESRRRTVQAIPPSMNGIMGRVPRCSL
ncbi:hypothetical protein BJ508DRAFT_328931 [Ascobolus immersus RN42]|uniref:Uncharacterized protein n=1 Tax=Ascobolus immersus RN42 TaxID=1160509 RepID=A0A3N4HZZ1_ASCIM|nr:hypothetical protein BJ508DRAFT_328931 [Ascobolus immersus RN42]